MAGEMGLLSRTWSLDQYTALAADLTFSFDASPWGIGGVLAHKGRIVSWFMDAVTDGDLMSLKLKRDAAAQQALEALAVLVGMRLWKAWWAQRRCTVALRGDNMTALTVALTLRAPKGPVKRIARILALGYSEAAFEPTFAEHVAGVSKILADLLSRRHDPAH